MKIQNVLLAILVAICAGCDKESPSESFETGDVVLNIISTDSSTDVDSFSYEHCHESRNQKRAAILPQVFCI